MASPVEIGRAGALALTGIALSFLLAGAPAGAQCVGDCDHNGAVGINELITGVNISLGEQDVSTCEAFADANNMVGIGQLIKGVNNSLEGCPATPTATTGTTPPATEVATPTATNTVGATATNTVGATATNTAGATATNTGGATATNTVGATATNTVGATATNTVGATATNTVGATATNTGGATATNTVGATATNTGGATDTPTTTETPSLGATPTATPTATVVATCPLTAGRYTITNSTGGTLRVASIGPFPFPSGGTVVQDISAGDVNCVHTTTIPFPGGFSAPQFCIPVLNFNVILAQTGCGVGRIDSNGGSDFTVHEVGDTSAPSAPCALPDPDCNPSMLPDDNNLRVDVTVGDSTIDTCAVGTTANAISVIPVQTTTWTNPPLTCPDPDGQYDPGTDTLITQFPQILDFTTDTNKAEWGDIDVDGCSISGSGPAAGFTGTGVCIDNAHTTVTTAAAGAVASKAAPLHDLTFVSVLPSTLSGPIAGSSSCGSPPAINFAGTATRCLSAP